MIIEEEIDMPLEIPVDRKAKLEAKKFVIVQNHVREIFSKSSECNVVPENNKSCQISEDKPQKCKKRRKTNPTCKYSTESEDNANTISEISQSNLEELRTVYNKCRSIIKKMEAKYGHLLNLNTESELKKSSDEALDEECHCAKNKKIIFKDDGEEEIIETDIKDHICPKRIKTSHVEIYIPQNVEIQYGENDLQLSDDMECLTSMLKNPDLEITHRNKVIDKIRSMKQEFLNEIRFNKHSLVEKLKLNPDELLDFKGTNLSTLPGYL